jgi:gamma-tubulin complex component 2
MWRELPMEAQESILMEELFYAMLGIEGKHIYLRENVTTGRYQYAVDPCVDHSIAALVGLSLPVCDAVLDVTAFVQAFSEPTMGQVANAMSSMVAKVQSDWQIAITQYERALVDGKLSLQNLYNNIQRPATTMLLVREICMDAMNVAPRGARGGQLLNMVHERFQRTAGDPLTQNVFVRIVQAASRPYWDMLRSWIYRGVIRDPHGEFLVEENKLMSGFSYSWEEKFKLRDDTDVPQFLQPVADKILVTGKYLDIIRECNIGEFGSSSSTSPSRPHASSSGDSFDFQPFDRSYIDKIETAYAEASSKLLTLLQSEYKLLEKLRSMKRYFLLDQSDFCSQFMDVAGEELRKKALFASTSGLQASLELALRSSSARNDPFGEDLVCGLHPRSLGSHIVALSANQLLPHLTLESNKGALPDDVQELFGALRSTPSHHIAF